MAKSGCPARLAILTFDCERATPRSVSSPSPSGQPRCASGRAANKCSGSTARAQAARKRSISKPRRATTRKHVLRTHRSHLAVQTVLLSNIPHGHPTQVRRRTARGRATTSTRVPSRRHPRSSSVCSVRLFPEGATTRDRRPGCVPHRAAAVGADGYQLVAGQASSEISLAPALSQCAFASGPDGRLRSFRAHLGLVFHRFLDRRVVAHDAVAFWNHSFGRAGGSRFALAAAKSARPARKSNAQDLPRAPRARRHRRHRRLGRESLERAEQRAPVRP